MIDYLRDPDEIYRRSFAAIRAEAPLDGLPEDMAAIVVRLIHACGMTDIVSHLAYSPEAPARGRRALRSGAPVLADCRMVAEGIDRRHLPAGNPVVCTLGEISAEEARARGTTRSAVAVERWATRLEGALVAIGNAPTALFRLIELIEDGAPPPALVLAFPVGFIGAAEAKEALVERAAGLASGGLAHITLRGRRGGSALAAAAVNALARQCRGAG